MASMANFMEEAVLNHFFRGQATASPSQVYVVLYISDPTDNDTGTEVNGAGYARQVATFSAPTQSSGKAVIQNNAKIEFPVAGANWGTVTHIGIRTAATGGSLLAYAPLAISKAVNTGDQITFDVNSVTISLT